MSFKLHLFAIAASLGFIGVIFELVRRKLLKESYSLIWFFVGGGFLFLSLFGDSIGGLSKFAGFQVASNAIFVYAIFLILILVLGLTVAITRLSKASQEMAQEMGLLKNMVEEAKNKNESGGSGKR